MQYTLSFDEIDIEVDKDKVKKILVEEIISTIKSKNQENLDEKSMRITAEFLIDSLCIVEDACENKESYAFDYFNEKLLSDFQSEADDELRMQQENQEAEEQELKSWYGTKGNVLGV